MEETAVHTKLQAIAAKLKLVRVVRGWTLDDAAQKTGLNRSTINRLETGKQVPNVGQLFLFGKVYGRAPEWFFSGDITNADTVTVALAESVSALVVKLLNQEKAPSDWETHRKVFRVALHIGSNILSTPDDFVKQAVCQKVRTSVVEIVSLLAPATGDRQNIC